MDIKSELQRYNRQFVLFVYLPRIIDDGVVVGVVLLHLGRGHVKGAPPDLDLLLAVLGRRLRLVEAGQPAVVALVQPPRLLHRQILLSDGVQDDLEGVLGPGQKGGVGDVELEAVGLEGRAAGRGLVLARLAQIRVVPAKDRSKL